jgi:hypothetical protein
LVLLGTDVGGGWYRVSICTRATNTDAYRFYVNQTLMTAEAGDGTSGIYIQSAQLEQGLVARDYIETTTAAVYGGITDNTPRLDYTDSSCPALLLEPLRTNLITQSEYFGGYGNNNSTDEANATTSPEGLVNATSFLEAATTSQHKLVASYGFDGSSTYTFSVFAKHNGRDLYIDTGNSNEWGARAWFDLTAGTANPVLGTADIEDFGNGWYRCIVTGASTLAGGNSIELLTSDGSTNSTTGDITKGVYIYGAQLEAASYPTSYIPTYGSSVSRVAETCTDAGTSATFNSTEGVLYAEISGVGDGGTKRYISLSDGANSNDVRLYLDTNGYISALTKVGGSTQAFLSTNAYAQNNFNKIAFKYKENDFALWVNGVEVATDNSGLVNAANTFNELSFFGNNLPFYGKTKQILTFNTALSDEELAALTTI